MTVSARVSARPVRWLVWRVAVYYYRSAARDSTALTLRIRDIVSARPHYGCQRVYVVLRREASRTTIDGCTGYTAPSGCRCGCSAPAATERHAVVRRRRRRQRRIRSGAWTSLPTRYLRVGACGRSRWWTSIPPACPWMRGHPGRSESARRGCRRSDGRHRGRTERLPNPESG